MISYRHGVNLAFDLFVPGQGPLQAFLGVQLRVSTLVNVSSNIRLNISPQNAFTRQVTFTYSHAFTHWWQRLSCMLHLLHQGHQTLMTQHQEHAGCMKLGSNHQQGLHDIRYNML